MANILERVCAHYLPLVRGWSITCLDKPGEVAAVMPAVHPELVCAPPGVWETLAARSNALRSVGLDAMRHALVGPAPCATDVLEFWRELALTLVSVHGMPETTGVAGVGDVGRVLPGVELSVSERGEVLVRGDVIMRGYRNRADATATAIDAEGWLRPSGLEMLAPAGALTR
jgi:long-chain acyl-CoA synthetase